MVLMMQSFWNNYNLLHDNYYVVKMYKFIRLNRIFALIWSSRLFLWIEMLKKMLRKQDFELSRVHAFRAKNMECYYSIYSNYKSSI